MPKRERRWRGICEISPPNPFPVVSDRMDSPSFPHLAVPLLVHPVHTICFCAPVPLLAAGTILLSFALLPTYQRVPGAVLSGLLLALSWIDAIRGRLPNRLTAAVGLVGLALAASEGSVPNALIGAVFGFPLTGGGLAWAYRPWRGRDGLGFGDVKLTAALGAVVGWQAVPAVLFLASLAGIAFVLGQLTH